MRIEKGNPNIFRITLSGYELAALISSARWVAEGAKGEVSTEAINNINQVLQSYDDETQKFEQQMPQKTRFKLIRD